MRKESQRMNNEMSSVSWSRKMLSKEWYNDVMENYKSVVVMERKSKRKVVGNNLM